MRSVFFCLAALPYTIPTRPVGVRSKIRRENRLLVAIGQVCALGKAKTRF